MPFECVGQQKFLIDADKQGLDHFVLSCNRGYIVPRSGRMWRGEEQAGLPCRHQLKI